MRVAGGGQREVADVQVAIARLLERAQHQIAQDALLGLALDLGDELLIIARSEQRVVERHHFGFEFLHRSGAGRQRVAELRRDFLEFDHALGIGTIVNAEDHGLARGLDVRRHGFVGGQHELLDQAVRDVAGRARHGGHRAELVEFEQRLGQIEIDGAAALALLVQQQSQLAHHLEARHQWRVAHVQLRVAFQHLVHGGIRHALGAADHAAREVLRHHVAMVVDFEQRAHHQAILVRAQRALIGG